MLFPKHIANRLAKRDKLVIAEEIARLAGLNIDAVLLPCGYPPARAARGYLLATLFLGGAPGGMCLDELANVFGVGRGQIRDELLEAERGRRVRAATS